MLNPIKVLTVGHSKETIESLQQVLRKQTNVKSAARLLNGHVDPLQGIRELPDVLLLQVGQNWENELAALNVRPPSLRPTILAMGPSNDPNLLRRAMKMGVRDFLTVPIDEAEVITALKQIQEEKRSAQNPVPQRITAVLNAKGGSGATLLASNLSTFMAEKLKLRVALVDLDLQLGASALCLNLSPKTGIGDALSAADEVDSAALRGYMTHHGSGLDVLANVPHTVIEPTTVTPNQVDHLLTVVAQNYDHVVVDLPRSIDSLTLQVLARADRIVLVLQQHLSHLHDAKRLLNALRGHLDDVDNRVTVAINRYEGKGNIGIREIQGALGLKFHALIPNDYKRVCKAEDQGTPLYQYAPSAAITKSLSNLARNLAGVQPVKGGLLRRLFSSQQTTQ